MIYLNQLFATTIFFIIIYLSTTKNTRFELFLTRGYNNENSSCLNLEYRENNDKFGMKVLVNRSLHYLTTFQPITYLVFSLLTRLPCAELCLPPAVAVQFFKTDSSMILLFLPFSTKGGDHFPPFQFSNLHNSLINNTVFIHHTSFDSCVQF